jgi:mannose-6-phosphate isomerase-like protein (cupin superfamily)
MIKHHFSAGTYIREMDLKAHHYADTHKHNYDHFGVLGSGAAAVEIDGCVNVHVGPCVIEIKAGKEHRITALSDLTWFCIHATSETDPLKIDKVLIKGE